MGYAPSAWYEKVSEDISLLYMDITWAELEPEEGVYDWEAIEKRKISSHDGKARGNIWY